MKNVILIIALFMTTVVSAQLTAIGTENAGEAHVKVIFLSEGFTSSEQSSFVSYANQAASAIGNLEPFASNSDKINFYYDFKSSNNSGISTKTHALNPVTNNIIDTRYDAYWNFGGQGHSIYVDWAIRDYLESWYSQYTNSEGNPVYLVMICNTSGWGGSGELPSYAFDIGTERYTQLSVISLGTNHHNVNMTNQQKLTTWANNFNFLACHEFMHSFGDLADEYISSPTYTFYSQNYPDIMNHIETLYNVSDTSSSSFPYQGAAFQATGMWRNHSNDLMKGTPSSSTGAWTYPMFLGTRTLSYVTNKLNEQAYVTEVQFTMDMFGHTRSDLACDNVNQFGTFYHNGNQTRPTIGDVIYKGLNHTLRVNGNNRWYEVSTYGTYTIKINTIGVVTAISTYCPGGVIR